MKIFIRTYIVVSILILVFSIYVGVSSFGGLIHKTKPQYYTMEQLSNPEETAAEQFNEYMKETLNKNIHYSCIYGGYAILSIVFSCVILSKSRRTE